jgi:O-antigen/teichoic acid export membrane protein
MTALYLRTVQVIAAITAPLTLGMLAVRVPLVEVLFGPKWHGAADVLMWLAPTGFLQSISSTTGAVLKARGRTDILFRLGALGAVVQVSAFVIGARTGVNAVAAWYFAANLLLSPIALFCTMQQLDGPWTRIVRACLPAFASALLMAVLTSALDGGLAEVGLNPVPRLAAGVLFGALAYGVGLRFIDPGSVQELLSLLRRRRQGRASAAGPSAVPAHGLTSPQQQRTISEQSD